MLAEIHQDEAEGETGRVYARIMQVQGTNVVNLIWRHLATIEGALGWAWPAVEAVLPKLRAQAGPALAEADAVARRHRLAELERPALPEMAADVVRTYNRGNCFNMLAMTTLAALRAGLVPTWPGEAGPGEGRPGEAGPGTPGPRESQPTLRAVPPMPHYDRLDAASRASIDALAAAGPAHASGVRPSLWVHLAQWPGVLEETARLVVPLLRNERFVAAHAELRDGVARRLGLEGQAPGTAPVVAARAAPVVAARAAPVDVAINRFRQRIPEMLLVGRVMTGDVG